MTEGDSVNSNRGPMSDRVFNSQQCELSRSGVDDVLTQNVSLSKRPKLDRNSTHRKSRTMTMVDPSGETKRAKTKETTSTSSGNVAPSDAKALCHGVTDAVHVVRSPPRKTTKFARTAANRKRNAKTTRFTNTASDVIITSDRMPLTTTDDDSATRRSSRARRRPGYYGVPVHDLEQFV